MADEDDRVRLLEPAQQDVARKAQAAGYKITVVGRKLPLLYLYVPTVQGRDHRVMVSRARASAYLGIDFGRYVKLGDYVALLDKDTKTIDVAFNDASQSWLGFYFTEEWGPFERYVGDGPIGIGRDFSTEKFAIAAEPKTLTLLARGRSGAKPGVASLCINVGSDNPDEAFQQLNTLGPAFCFEFDCKFGVGLQLARSKERVDTELDVEYDYDYSSIEVPRNRYDSDVLWLYLEGRASAAPLSQYLLYYQVLEYFFAPAVRAEAMELVGRIIRDPRYPYGSIEQLQAIVASAQSLGSNLNEREQLKVLLPHIADRSHLISHISQLKGATEALESKKQSVQGVFPVKMSLDNNHLLDNIAIRVYAIRNRIVHSKGRESVREAPPLWPTSAEVSALGPDVALLRYLAQRALIRYSSAIGTTT